MKKILLSFIIGLLAFPMLAQSNSNRKEKSFRFVYIAHDVSTPVARLVDRLRENRNEAMDGGEDVVFYLANGENPIIVEFNVGKNNQEDFDEVLLSELNERNSHDVDAETDKEMILSILNSLDIVDENKHLNYMSAKFNFYVGSKFWTLKNNEAIIAPIFFAYDIPGITGGRVQFQIIEAIDDRIPAGDLFGEKNIGNINKITATDRTQY